MIKENGMHTFYGEYLSMPGLLMKISSILLQFRGKLSLPLVDYVNLTSKTPSGPKRGIYGGTRTW